MKRNILLIGASGDIGSAIAEQLLQHGYQLILHYYTNKRVIDELCDAYPESILATYQTDLSKNRSCEQLMQSLSFSIDGVVFASGKAHYGLFQDTNEETMDAMIQLHVKSPWLITKHLLPDMIAKQAGFILFITSIWGEQGASNEVVYSAVKGAQNSFVKALAKEVAPSGISVNAISPGYIETKMNHHLCNEERKSILSEIPMNRAGKPEEIASVVTFLLDSEKSYIQGAILDVTGGW
ncbi:elongation factor P 5-aminopentanone reductase [Virgibacillus chiguensis]|uniref:3-oxoacyl-[acyl-carrier protein] reductase n=1 Tax=Virgibacillus chiguensis TaxID=411959 RepID=A0A1M5N263_9BACI|nr:SDR family oxidoreductase [Virgibacillus chiguensis]SHG83650.1 3-oxoacyl-[acyl-carrier protein] reductase [Virgibacillus chiguensis]